MALSLFVGVQHSKVGRCWNWWWRKSADRVEALDALRNDINAHDGYRGGSRRINEVASDQVVARDGRAQASSHRGTETIDSVKAALPGMRILRS